MEKLHSKSKGKQIPKCRNGAGCFFLSKQMCKFYHSPSETPKQGAKLKTLAGHLSMQELVVTMSTQLAGVCELLNEVYNLLHAHVPELASKHLFKSNLTSFLQGTGWKVRPQDVAATVQLPTTNIQ